jgi:hypothetical protein
MTFGVFAHRLAAKANRSCEGCGDEKSAGEALVVLGRFGHGPGLRFLFVYAVLTPAPGRGLVGHEYCMQGFEA